MNIHTYIHTYTHPCYLSHTHKGGWWGGMGKGDVCDRDCSR